MEQAEPKMKYKDPMAAGILTFIFGPFLGMFYVGSTTALVGWIIGALLFGAFILLINLFVFPYADNFDDAIVTFMIVGLYLGIFIIPSVIYAVYATKRRNLRYSLESPINPCQRCGFNLKDIEESECPGCGSTIRPGINAG